MPLLLLKYWKEFLAGGAILIVGVYVGFLKIDLWRLKADVAQDSEIISAFKSVQTRNNEAIAAQNRAIRKMWIRKKREETADVVASGIMARAIVESQQPIRFTQKSTCDDKVREVFLHLRRMK